MFNTPKIFSVRELNFAAKQLIEGGLPLLWVRGEISNFVCAASGHWYFSLKDEAAQVRCVMFRHKSQYLDWQPKNGMQVEVRALASLYEARGEFQLTLEQMRPAGLGALYEAFERLKNKLEREGLFAPERKRDLPFLPRQIGLITSPQAAALRDVLTTLAQRMPSVPVILYPTPVQGVEAGQKIAQTIRLANQRAECDVLMVCRGGGSIEDLWAFNEEVVARAIADSDIPLVSGVGHETDFTIADFVADLRAATPTAAAQAVVPAQQELQRRLQHWAQQLQRANQRQMDAAMQRLDEFQRRLIHPAERTQQQRAVVAQWAHRMQRAMRHQLQRQGWQWQAVREKLSAAQPNLSAQMSQIHALENRLKYASQGSLERHSARLAAAQQHLQHLNPQQVLARGYSMVRDAQGRLLSSSQSLQQGARLELIFAEGRARVEVV
jgi:exodeoxyribonuclease VII large subunit